MLIVRNCSQSIPADASDEGISFSRTNSLDSVVRDKRTVSEATARVSPKIASALYAPKHHIRREKEKGVDSVFQAGNLNKGVPLLPKRK